MLAYTYIKQGTFALMEKPKPTLLDDRDAIVRVTLSSICTRATRWWAWWRRWAPPSPPCAPATG